MKPNTVIYFGFKTVFNVYVIRSIPPLLPRQSGPKASFVVGPLRSPHPGFYSPSALQCQFFFWYQASLCGASTPVVYFYYVVYYLSSFFSTCL